MDSKRQVKISKFLSKHLRHTPERLNIQLSTDGWVEVDELLAACTASNFLITRAELYQVVIDNDKQRSAL